MTDTIAAEVSQPDWLSVKNDFERALESGAQPRLAPYLDRRRRPDRHRLAMLADAYRQWSASYSGECSTWLSDLLRANRDLEVDIVAALAEITTTPTPERDVDFASETESREDGAFENVGLYTLYQKVGDGGFAEVYIGGIKGQRQLYAVKLLRTTNGDAATAELLLRRERIALKRLPAHPCLLRFEDWEPDPHRPAVVTPYIDGVSLIVERKRRAPNLDQVIRDGLALCEAVQTAHEAGVRHRDITPANVLRRSHDESVVLIDFGLAELRDDHSDLPEPELCRGATAPYAAPELYAAGLDPPNGILIDVYGIGAVLYHQLVGKGPTEGEDREETRRLAERGDIDRTALTSIDCSDGLRGVVSRALSRDPRNRYPHPAELADALRSTTEGRRLLARDWRKRNRGAVAATLGVLAVAALLTQTGLLRLGSPASQLAELVDPDAWVEKVAAERGVELGGVQQNEVRIDILAPSRIAEISAVERVTPDTAGLLVVEADPSLAQFEDSLSYRVGASRWRRFPYRDDRGRPYAKLTTTDLAERGPVEVRLGGVRDKSSSAGPWAYDVDVNAAVQRDQEASMVALRREASKADFLRFGLGGWRMLPEFVERFEPVVIAYRCWPEDGSRAQATEVSSASEPSDERSLTDRFKTALGPASNTRAIWTQVGFESGEWSPPRLLRRVNPYGHDGTTESARRILGELPDGLPPALWRAGDFTLAGLALIDLSIESIEFGVTADKTDAVYPAYCMTARPTHQTKSSSQLLEIARSNLRMLSTDREGSGARRFTFFEGVSKGSVGLPPVWRSVYVRARLADGSVTRTFRTDNALPLPGYELKPVRSTPNAGSVRTFLYGYAPSDAPMSVQRPQSEWPADAWLFTLIDGEGYAQYFADAQMRTRLDVVRPGDIYVRIVRGYDDPRGAVAYKVEKPRLMRVLEEAARLPVETRPERPARVIRPAVTRAVMPATD